MANRGAQKAREVMTELMQYVDVLIANEEDSADVFGITADKTDIIPIHVIESIFILLLYRC